MQKILIMHTEKDSLRAQAFGWMAEDATEAKLEYERLYYNLEAYCKRPVGLMGYYGKNTGDRLYCYPTPYHAMGMGWRLMVPPTKYTETRIKANAEGIDTKYEQECYEWWFTKD